MDWLVNDEVIQTLEVGASFGELALLHNEPRSMTIRASLNHGVTMATIDKPDFLRIVEPEMKIKMDSYRPFLSKIELFEDFRTIHIVGLEILCIFLTTFRIRYARHFHRSILWTRR